MNTSTHPDSLRLTTCPRCGYSLEGLPDDGVCPECGAPYDQSEVVLHGYGAGHYGGVAAGRPAAAAVSAVVVLVTLGWCIHRVVRKGVNDVFDIAWPAVIGLSLVWSLWKRSRSDMPGLVQVRLSRDGVIQVNNPTAGREKIGKPTPWQHVADVRIRTVGDDRVRIEIVEKTTFWKGKRVAVDADVQLANQQAQAVVERVEAWWSPRVRRKSAAST
jgi:hypothetical protein